MDLGAISARLTLNINNFSSNLRRAEEEIRNTERQFSGFSDIGKRFSDVGDKLTMGLTLPIVGLGVAAGKMSTDFNAGMANVATMIPKNTERIQELKENVQDLAIETGKSTGDLADGLYQVVSAFGDSAESAKLLEINAKAAKAGVASTTDSINLTSAVTKGYGDTSAEAVEHVADLAFQTVKLGQTTFPELASAIGKVVPIAQSMGISMEEIFASEATLTGVTGTAAEVTTQLRGTMQAFMAPSKGMQKLIDELGFSSGEAMIKQLGFKGAIDKVVEASKKTGAPLQNFMGSIEGQTAALALSGAQSDVYKTKLEQMKVSTGAMTEAFDEQTKGVNKNGFSMEQLKEKLQVLAQKFGDTLGPMIAKVVDKLSGMLDKLNKLSPAQQEQIVKIGLWVAAIGPLLSITGRLFGSITSIAGGLKTVSSLFSLTTAATTTAAPAVAGVGTAFAGALVPLLPWIAGIGAAGFAIYKLAKYFKSDAIPAVDLFGDKTSESTKKAVSAYMSLDDKATKSLMNLNYRSEKVSKETATSLTKNFNDMGSKIKDGLDKHYKESEKTMGEFFKNSNALTDKEEQEALKKMQASNEAKKKEIDGYLREINEIISKANKEGRELKEEEVRQINDLQQKMKENAVKALSETELESKVILERMKEQQGELTAQQAADVVKNSNDQKEKAIKAANEQYDETLRWIIRQRDEVGSISDEQAEKLKKAAEKQRDEAVKKANDMHSQVVEHAKKQAGEHAYQVDWESGQVRDKFDAMMAKIREFNALPIKEKVITITQKINSIFEKQNSTGLGTYTGSGSIGGAGKAYAKGTDNHPGGLAVAGEEGEELVIGPDGQVGLTANTATLYNLPKGTKVIPHGKTKSILSSFNVPGYKDGVGISSDEKKQGLIDQIENKFGLQYSNLELAMIKLGVNTRTFTEEVKKQQSEIDILNKKLALMKNEYNEIVKVAGANSDEAISLRNNIASLTVEIANSTEELKDKISKNAEEAKEKVISETNDLVERVKSALEEKYQEEERKQEESLQKQLDNIEAWKEKSISKIEEVFDKKLEKLEEDEELSEKVFEEESNQLDKWKETSIRNIEDVANAKRKSLQAQIDALDEQAKADERAEADKEELAKIQRLKDKIEFEHNEFNKAELQKELNNVIAERNKRLHQQEIEDKKEALSKQIDAIAEDAEKQKQSIEDVYSARKEDLEKRIKESERYFAEQKKLIEKNRKDQQEAIEKTYTFQKGIIEKQQADWKAFYDKKLQDATLQAEAEKLVMDNNQKEIVELLHTYEPEYLAAGQSLGEKLVEGFAPKIQAIKDMIASINAEISAARSNAISAMATASQASSAISAASSSNSKGTTNNSTTNSVVNNNNITFNSPISLTPSEVLRKTETVLRKLVF